MPKNAKPIFLSDEQYIMCSIRFMGIEMPNLPAGEKVTVDDLMRCNIAAENFLGMAGVFRESKREWVEAVWRRRAEGRAYAQRLLDEKIEFAEDDRWTGY